MSHTPHELAEDFPDKVDQIHALKQSDAHFAKLAATYHDVNRVIHRTETGVEPMGEAAEQDMRRQRMVLKDEIARMLAAV